MTVCPICKARWCKDWVTESPTFFFLSEPLFPRLVISIFVILFILVKSTAQSKIPWFLVYSIYIIGNDLHVQSSKGLIHCPVLRCICQNCMLPFKVEVLSLLKRCFTWQIPVLILKAYLQCGNLLNTLRFHLHARSQSRGEQGYPFC